MTSRTKIIVATEPPHSERERHPHGQPAADDQRECQREDGERELRRDLELLLATVPRVVVTWQSVQDGEANLLAPELALLSTLHQLAWGDDLRRPPLAARGEAVPTGECFVEAGGKLRTV